MECECEWRSSASRECARALLAQVVREERHRVGRDAAVVEEAALHLQLLRLPHQCAQAVRRQQQVRRQVRYTYEYITISFTKHYTELHHIT